VAYDPLDPHADAQEWVRTRCGHLLLVGDINWNRASYPTHRYNCMGLAMQNACGGFLGWWQPPKTIGKIKLYRPYWPKSVRQDTTIDAYVDAAATVGFKVTASPAWEDGAEKVTLYHYGKDFKHATRWLSPTERASKIGEYSDIVHGPDALDLVINWGDGRVHLTRHFS